MCYPEFPSSASDLRTIFDILDSAHAGAVNYREIVKTILSDYQVLFWFNFFLVQCDVVNILLFMCDFLVVFKI